MGNLSFELWESWESIEMKMEGLTMNSRLEEITKKIVGNIHEVIVEYQINDTELMQALNFLTEVGKRGEYQLLSDVLGISVLVDEITHGQEEKERTAHNVEGPLYRPNAPKMGSKAKICSDDDKGDRLILTGQVLSAENNHPLAHALVDVWQANENGDYENQDENQADYNLRGLVETDEEGRFTIETVIPGPYEIAKAGPIGGFLEAIGRHDWRPGHIHFKVSHKSCSPLTTMLFVPNDPWIDSDAIGAVRDSLIMKFEKIDAPEEITKYNVDQPFFLCKYDFILNTCESRRVEAKAETLQMK